MLIPGHVTKYMSLYMFIVYLFVLLFLWGMSVSYVYIYILMKAITFFLQCNERLSKETFDLLIFDMDAR